MVKKVDPNRVVPDWLAEMTAPLLDVRGLVGTLDFDAPQTSAARARGEVDRALDAARAEVESDPSRVHTLVSMMTPFAKAMTEHAFAAQRAQVEADPVATALMRLFDEAETVKTGSVAAAFGYLRKDEAWTRSVRGLSPWLALTDGNGEARAEAWVSAAREFFEPIYKPFTHGLWRLTSAVRGSSTNLPGGGDLGSIVPQLHARVGSPLLDPDAAFFRNALSHAGDRYLFQSDEVEFTNQDPKKPSAPPVVKTFAVDELVSRLAVMRHVSMTAIDAAYSAHMNQLVMHHGILDAIYRMAALFRDRSVEDMAEVSREGSGALVDLLARLRAYATAAGHEL